MSSNDSQIHAKLDEILKRLTNVDQLKMEIQCMKSELLGQSKSQEDAVRRLAGNFEHLLNSQRELEGKFVNIEKLAGKYEESMESINKNILSYPAAGTSLSDSKVEEVEEVSKENLTSVPRKTEEQKMDNTADKTKKKLEETSKGSITQGEKTVTAEKLEKTNEVTKTVRKEEDVEKTSVENQTSAALLKRYKCYICNNLLPYNEDDPFAKCLNDRCRRWNILGKLKPEHKWIALADPCGHLQQVPCSRKVGEKWTCTQCGKLGKIDAAFEIPESEEITGTMEEVIKERQHWCSTCLERLYPDGKSDSIVCPKCSNKNTISAVKRFSSPSRAIFKCCVCHTSLPRNRDVDGVSVKCVKCGVLNSAEKAKAAYRWVRLASMRDFHCPTSVCEHAFQLSIDIPELVQMRCIACSASGFVTDNANLARIVHVSLDESNFIFKCQQCKVVLPKSEDTDKVRVNCPECKSLYLVGRLKDGYKWIFLKPCKHFQQSEKYNKCGETVNCNVCQKPGTVNDVQQRWIPTCEEADDDEYITECSHCRTLLPTTLREDGMSAECTKCGHIVMTGGLKKGHRWAVCQPCGHCMQIPLDKKQDHLGVCHTCNKPGIILTQGLSFAEVDSIYE